MHTWHLLFPDLSEILPTTAPRLRYDQQEP